MVLFERWPDRSGYWPAVVTSVRRGQTTAVLTFDRYGDHPFSYPAGKRLRVQVRVLPAGLGT